MILISHSWKRGLIIGVFWAYIALFAVKVCDIGSLSFPKLVTSMYVTSFSPQSFYTKTCFYSFHKLLAANSNTLGPAAITNVFAVRQ